MTSAGDLVLVHMDDQPTFFARIESIDPDIKTEWFQVKMLVLQLPLIVVTWILREPYINGEQFTMGGRPIKITKVVSPEEKPAQSSVEQSVESLQVPPSSASQEGKKVVSLADRRKKNHHSS
jgi:hypothetical protein